MATADGAQREVIDGATRWILTAFSFLFESKVADGYLGSFEINENGDPSGAEGAVVGFTIYKATDKLQTVKTISPKPENVDAARG